MFKIRTIAQFKVMEHLKENFDIRFFLVWPASRSGLVLEDRQGEQLAFRLQEDDIVEECPVPSPASRVEILQFEAWFQDRFPDPHDQTFENRTKFWLERPSPLTYQQALGLSAALFRYYLTHQVPDTEDVLSMISGGSIPSGQYPAIKLWYLDGHFMDSSLVMGGVDGDGFFAYLTLRSPAGKENTHLFHLEDG